jgi:hypothetical protein
MPTALQEPTVWQMYLRQEMPPQVVTNWGGKIGYSLTERLRRNV